MLSAAIAMMTSHLSSLVGQVQRSCVQLVSASTEIAATSQGTGGDGRESSNR